jgi:hypothetical protein
MCPPNSADKCDCRIYDDSLDEAKNSENIAESIFSRATLIVGGGIDGFGNFSYLTNHILNENIKIFGDGLGVQILFTPIILKNKQLKLNQER